MQCKTVSAKQADNKYVVGQKAGTRRRGEQGVNTCKRLFGSRVDKNNACHCAPTIRNRWPFEDRGDVTAEFYTIDINWFFTSGYANTIIKVTRLKSFSRGFPSKNQWFDHQEL